MKKTKKAGGPIGIMPTTDFRDTPFGDGVEMNFRAGIMSPPVPAEFAERMKEKGLAAGKPSAPKKAAAGKAE